MAEKCVNCGLVFKTSNELDWHIREEHMKRAAPPRVDHERQPVAAGEREPVAAGEREPGAAGGRESAASGDEPSGRPRWLRAARRLVGRRRPESPSGQVRG